MSTGDRGIRVTPEFQIPPRKLLRHKGIEFERGPEPGANFLEVFHLQDRG